MAIDSGIAKSQSSAVRIHQFRGEITMYKRIIRIQIILAVLTLSILQLSAGPQKDKADDPQQLIVIDHYNREILIKKDANRIVSLAPGITETFFALGYGGRLIGRTEFCNYPPRAEEIDIVGTLTDIDLEVLVAIDPNLVIAGTHFSKENMQKLENLGIPVVILMAQQSFEGTYDGIIRPIGRILGDEKAAEKLINSMESTRLAAIERVKHFPKSPRIYFVVGFGEGGDWTAGGNTFIGQIIEMAGGINVAADIDGWSYSLEALLSDDPDIIIVPEWALEIFPATPIYSELRASRNRKIYTINEDIISRQGPRLSDALSDMVTIIEKAL